MNLTSTFGGLAASSLFLFACVSGGTNGSDSRAEPQASTETLVPDSSVDASVPEPSSSDASIPTWFLEAHDLVDARFWNSTDDSELPFVVVRAWPGNNLQALQADVTVLAEDRASYVFECSYTRHTYEQFVSYMDGDAWRDESSAAEITWGPRIEESFFSGRYRGCVLRMRIENVSDSEASMIAGEADRIRVPYDFDGWTEECPPVNTALDKIAVHHEWSNDRNQLYVCS